MRELLLKYEKVFTLAGLSKISGINQKQLSHYKNGISIPRDKQNKKLIESLHKLGKELVEIEII